MLDSVRLYFRYIGISVRAQMQYRASFVLMTIGTCFGNLIEFAGIWALFQRFDNIGGWSLPEIAILYGMVHIAFAIAEAAARGFDLFPGMVKSGDFDRILLRPRTTGLQIGAQHLQLMRVGALAQGIVVLLWGSHTLHIAWTAPKLGLLLAAISGGACLFSGLFVLQATLAFWTTESLEIVNCFTYGGKDVGQYPLSIYRPWFRRVFTFLVPLATVNYFPAHAILGRSDPLGAPAFFYWLSPALGVVFLILMLQFWKVGVRHYRSTGS